MICRCPACGRTTPVATNLVGFLTRCERCRTLLLTRLRPPEPGDEPDAAASRLTLHVVLPGRVAESPATAGALADLLSRPKPCKKPASPPSPSDAEVWQAMQGLAAEATHPPHDLSLASVALERSEQERRLALAHPTAVRRRNLRAIVILGLATVGAVALYTLATNLEKALFRPESARGDASQATPADAPASPPAPSADSPATAVEATLPRTAAPTRAPAAPRPSQNSESLSSDDPNGDLFPRVPSQR